jgi:hypothetical protein
MLNLTQKRVRSPEQREEMKKVLDSYGIYELFHFTCVDNLELIAKCGGIWSKKKLENARLLDEVITCSNKLSHKLDKNYGNWNKVSLSFCYRHPMTYSIWDDLAERPPQSAYICYNRPPTTYPTPKNLKNLIQKNLTERDPRCAHICYLVIDQEVALWDKVVFTYTNAANFELGILVGFRDYGLKGLKLIDFEAIRKYQEGKWVERLMDVQAECLVPDEIPLSYIKSIVFISEASKKYGEYLWKKSGNPDALSKVSGNREFFKVNRDYFYKKNSPPCFAFVDDFKLTPSEKLDEKLKEFERIEDIREFSKSRHSKVALLLYLYLYAEKIKVTKVIRLKTTKLKTIWRDANGRKIKEDWREKNCPKTRRYWYISELDISQLNEGDYLVEFYLNDAKWFEAPFKIKA